jgi:hypothetical protein
MSQLDSNARNAPVIDEAINNEMVQNLKRIYDLYVEQRVDFAEQARLLSLLPRSWKYDMVIELFDCSKHAVKTAHRMYDGQKSMLKQDTEPSIRQRADPEKIKHFVNWLVESNTLVSGSY